MARGRLAAWLAWFQSLSVTDPQWPIAEGAVVKDQIKRKTWGEKKVGVGDKEKEVYMVLGRESIKMIKMYYY
jgi:hypothetical protein